MKNYEQALYDTVLHILNNMKYCIIHTYNPHGFEWPEYSFVNEVNIQVEYHYYDGFLGLSFSTGNYELVITPEDFNFLDVELMPGKRSVFWCSDVHLPPIDKESYFQCSMLENLHGIRWQTFPCIAQLRSMIIENYNIREPINGGFVMV